MWPDSHWRLENNAWITEKSGNIAKSLENKVQNLYSHLTIRKCVVDVNCTHSEVYTPTSGVLQGSNLNPAMFTVYANDFDRGRHCNLLTYADNSKLFRVCKWIQDCSLLRQSLGMSVKHCENNGPFKNGGKCSVCSFTKSKSTIICNHEINDVATKRVSSKDDLYSNINFKQRIENITCSSKQILSFVFRFWERLKSEGHRLSNLTLLSALNLNQVLLPMACLTEAI